MTNAFATRSATLVSARVKDGAQRTIVGRVLTMTKAGMKHVGFSALESEAPSLLDLVGQKVEMSSRYVKGGFMLVNGVAVAA